MNTTTYNKNASLLKHEADFLLKTHLKPLFDVYGRLIPVGSYDLDLMVWPDLDIQLDLQGGDPVSILGEISKDCLKLPNIKSIKLMNFNNRLDSKFPEGIYFGINYLPINQISWKVDLWVQSAHEAQKTLVRMEQFRSKLDAVSREVILRWKHKLLTSEGRVVKHGSFALYKAVLDEGYRTDHEIQAYLAAEGIIPKG